jgi:IS605 OrfB family transposase
LQKKGTRSATRRKIAMSGRERRLKLQTNHTIAKQIAQAHPHTLLGLEELTGIRDRVKWRRKKNGKRTEPVSKKARRANRHASRWAFAELHGMIAYKAVLSRLSLAIKVDPDYTSQTCPMCGFTDERNRPGKGLLFTCRNPACPHRLRTGRPYTLHADLVGARNIAMRTLLTWQDWVRTGVLSARPDVSDSETKAARLKRYAELRWSSDTSSTL